MIPNGPKCGFWIFLGVANTCKVYCSAEIFASSRYGELDRFELQNWRTVIYIAIKIEKDDVFVIHDILYRDRICVVIFLIDKVLVN